MNPSQRRIVAQALRDHFGLTAVGECAEDPVLVVWHPGGDMLAWVESSGHWWTKATGRMEPSPSPCILAEAIIASVVPSNDCTECPKTGECAECGNVY